MKIHSIGSTRINDRFFDNKINGYSFAAMPDRAKSKSYKLKNFDYEYQKLTGAVE